MFSSRCPSVRAFRGLGMMRVVPLRRGLPSAASSGSIWRWRNGAIPSMHESMVALERDPFVLYDYARARRVIVGQEANPAKQPTVHRLLWGTPVGTGLNDWLMAAWETPAVGLPSRVAAALFKAVHHKATPNGWAPSQGPLSWVIDDVNGVLATGRRGQFVPEEEPKPAEQSPRMERSMVWEVLPHAAFYLPFVSATACEVHADSYVLYCRRTAPADGAGW